MYTKEGDILLTPHVCQLSYTIKRKVNHVVKAIDCFKVKKRVTKVLFASMNILRTLQNALAFRPA